MTNFNQTDSLWVYLFYDDGNEVAPYIFSIVFNKDTL